MKCHEVAIKCHLRECLGPRFEPRQVTNDKKWLGENMVIKVNISIDNFEICNKHHKYYPESLNKFC